MRHRRRILLICALALLLVLAAAVVQGCGGAPPEAGDRGFKGLSGQSSDGQSDGSSGSQNASNWGAVVSAPPGSGNGDSSSPGQAPSDIPIPGDAQNLVAGTATVQYDTSSAVSGVAAYYESGMADDGWSQSGSPSEFSNSVSLTFGKSGRTADVNIAEVTGNRTHVTISIFGS